MRWAMPTARRCSAGWSEFDVFGQVAKGDLSGVTGWLREHVHQYGQLLEPADVVRNACGTLDPQVYLDYLTRKYTELYAL